MYYLGLAIMLFPLVSFALLVVAVAALLLVGAYDVYHRLAARGRKKMILKPAESEVD